MEFPGGFSDPARPARNPDDGALTRLRTLHGEAGRNLALAQFVARVPAACVVLMLTGALALIWAAAAGGAGLKGSFAWAALVLLGIVAMIRLHIRGFARSLRRTPLAEAGSDLRLLLLYTGAVWGGGAFLIMPDQPAPALVFFFAALPSLGAGPDLAGCAGFCRLRRAGLGADRGRHAAGRLAAGCVGGQRHHGVAQPRPAWDLSGASCGRGTSCRACRRFSARAAPSLPPDRYSRVLG